MIINSHLELDALDSDVIKTCIAQLKEAKMIVLIHGRDSNSLNYRDYIVSANREIFWGWKNAKMKSKLEFIRSVISAATEGMTAGATLMAATH